MRATTRVKRRIDELPCFAGALRLANPADLVAAERITDPAAGGVAPRAAHCAETLQSLLSSTLVSGRSLPRAVSLCHLPCSSSYSIVSVRPGTRCSAAARRAAESAAA